MAAPNKTVDTVGITLSEDRGAGKRQLRAITSSNRVSRVLPSDADATVLATEFNRLNFELAKIERMVYSNPYATGVLFKDVALVIGNTTIEHKLGKQVRFEIKNPVGAFPQVYRPTSDVGNTSHITLTSSSTATVDILIVPEP